MSGIPFVSMTNPPYEEPTGQPSTREGINNFLPYDLGLPDEQSPAYERQLDLREEESRRTKSLNAAKKAIQQGKALGAFDTYANSSDPLAAAIQADKETDNNNALIRTIFEVYSTKEEIEKALTDNNLGTYEDAAITLAKNLGVEDGTRPDYIRNLLTGYEGKEYIGRFNYLVKKKIISLAVIDYWEDAGEIDADTASELKRMRKRALGQKTGKKLSLPKPKKITLTKTPKLATPKIKSLLEIQKSDYQVKAPSLSVPTMQVGQGLKPQNKPTFSVSNLPMPSGGIR